MLLPARTGLGEAEAATARSACPELATTTVAEALLLVGFGSGVVELTLAVSVICVPDAVPAATVKTGLKLALLPAASDAMVQVIVPALPNGGSVQDQPAGVVIEKKVVFAGSVSAKVTFAAAEGPLLVTFCA